MNAGVIIIPGPKGSTTIITTSNGSEGDMPNYVAIPLLVVMSIALLVAAVYFADVIAADSPNSRFGRAWYHLVGRRWSRSLTHRL